MHGSHLVSHIKHPDVRAGQPLYVIGVISNPSRYHSRYRLAREWIAAMEATPNVQLCMVETAYADRHHEVTDSKNPWHLQLRNKSEIWVKESMINLGVKHLLPKDWKYVAWVDCDVFFRNHSWALETVQQLQHHPVVQPWEDCVDLGPRGSILEHHKSFGSIVGKGQRRQKCSGEPYRFAHPGFAWACTRQFWEACRGLLDFAILGSADHHMATAMVNEVYTSMHGQMSAGFKRQVEAWQHRAHRHCRGDVGYVPGIIEHRFHGSKKKRYYQERWQILVDHGFDPEKDIGHDEQGMVQLLGKHQLELAVRAYNRSRHEDSIEE